MRQTILLSSSRSGGGCGCFLQLFLLFTLVPVAELWLLLVLSRQVGLLPTLSLVIFTGALGAWLARSQGLRAFQAVQAELNSGRMPTTSLLDGLMILIAGAVLLTPGLFTDVLGFLLLVPWTRALIRKALAAQMKERFVAASGASGAARHAGRRGPAPGAGAGAGASQPGGIRYEDHGYRDDDERIILVEDSPEHDDRTP